LRTTKERKGSAAPVATPEPQPSHERAKLTPPPETAGERVIGWVRKHRQLTGWVAGIAIVAVVFFAWNIAATRGSEAEARTSLQSARVAFEAHNLGLASSELARVRENYSGTKAAEEATLLLAQVRLQQGQNEQAIQMLQEFAPGASRDYRAQAFGLLGAALENAGRTRDAAQAFERAAEAAPLPFLKAQLLSDAGRAWVGAGDTARAVSAYTRITTELKETATVTEAAVRLGELTKGAAQVATP
jgi:tetratricopeptide (TPR) repeat protein